MVVWLSCYAFLPVVVVMAYDKLNKLFNKCCKKKVVKKNEIQLKKEEMEKLKEKEKEIEKKKKENEDEKQEKEEDLKQKKD